MSESPTYAVVLTVAVFAAVVVIDIVLALNRRKGDTYSEVLRSAGKRWWPFALIIAFAMGLLCGHWFWGACDPDVCTKFDVKNLCTKNGP